MKLNIANILTFLRIILIIPFVAFFLNDTFLIALIIFIVASLTDALDGYIARKFNMVTNLGKFLDPLADKILVISALICFVALSWIPAWTVVVIVAREFIVSGFRLAVVSKDNTAVIAADIWGKIKTAFTMLAIVWILIGALQPGENINDILMYICAALTVFSGVTMIWKNRKLFTQ
ncbi:MAG: CDP-diacylglycerol--glycerol-3-phosphate 3-phosphatidyltransferase [Oscillospiraceae bacterium]|nr:CDP-diacylglycerol--glycerol-3-phosphate 3-phosphatidyltransferase [Oscillospiraceae bacterium]